MDVTLHHSKPRLASDDLLALGLRKCGAGGAVADGDALEAATFALSVVLGTGVNA